MSVAARRKDPPDLVYPDSTGSSASADRGYAASSGARAKPAEEPAEAPSPTAASAAMPQRRRRSSLTRRILTLNLLALAIPVAGLLYLDQYRNSLVQQQLDLVST